MILRRRGRRSGDDRVLIDGVREIGRAIQAGVKVTELLYCQAMMDGQASALCNEFTLGGGNMIEVSEPVFEKIRYGDRTCGVVAIADRPGRLLSDLKLGERPLLAVIERVGKPGNLGAILRSADGAGVNGVLVVEPEIDIYGPNVIRASVSTVFSIPVVEVSLVEAIDFIRKGGLQIVAASPEGAKLYTEVDLRRPTAIVFGAEDQGLSAAWAENQAIMAKVPMRGLADSLNVSTTAALFFYEAFRQRG
jgi:TrmH family RNA methyltransferase